MLKKVTFTGVDDHTNVARLMDISARYPFVEWGLLVPTKGTGRWPSLSKMIEVVGTAALMPHHINLAAHICEPHVGALLRRAVKLEGLIGTAFGRVQINTHGRQYGRVDGWQNSLIGDREIILQLDGVTSVDLVSDLHEGGELDFAAGLVDLSHGAGVLPDSWPKAEDLPGHAQHLAWLGYAGGLGPDNIAAQLPLIAAAADDRDYWIDMETHVRTEGLFDLDKVERVLRIVCEILPATNEV